MVGQTRLELVTTRLWAGSSNQLSYWPKTKQFGFLVYQIVYIAWKLFYQSQKVIIEAKSDLSYNFSMQKILFTLILAFFISIDAQAKIGLNVTLVYKKGIGKGFYLSTEQHSIEQVDEREQVMVQMKNGINLKPSISSWVTLKLLLKSNQMNWYLMV